MLRLPAGGHHPASQHYKLPHHPLARYLKRPSFTPYLVTCAQVSGSYDAYVGTGSHTHVGSLGGPPRAHGSGSKAAMTGASSTRILSFSNAHGERLAAKFVDAGSQDIVILCHGYATSKDGFLFPQLAVELASRGRSSLRFDFAGNGESEGAFSFGNYFREVGDLRAAVMFVRDTLNGNVPAIVGESCMYLCSLHVPQARVWSDATEVAEAVPSHPYYPALRYPPPPPPPSPPSQPPSPSSSSSPPSPSLPSPPPASSHSS
ncbi:hypothetical protein Vretimale_17211 [Volvox reticuliferus]|uniref:Serine aminopeptidase S33 domain-containing protein n=1 Tax=Volvox reticuliferus TaxID=1737510 RepID=A0A8J4GUL2_9CHLO|nr:hypothetical protein Vretifemale_122 [Volvox reticuliferus]GIM14338.1 hypothetical protein Vretimale_17211 [Volvox reticuliferus]